MYVHNNMCILYIYSYKHVRIIYVLYTYHIFGMYIYIYTSDQAQGEAQIKAQPLIKRGKFWGNACRKTLVECSEWCVSICTFVLVKPANHKLGALENLLGKFVRCSGCRMRTHSTCSVRENIVYHRTSTVIMCTLCTDDTHTCKRASERANKRVSERAKA